MRTQSLLPFLLLLLLALAGASPALAVRPNSTKAVYYNGKLHYVSVDDNAVIHTEGVVSADDWKGPWDNPATVRLPLAKGWKRQTPGTAGVGEATVVYGALLVHYSVLLDPDNNPWICVSRFDLNTGFFLPDKSGAMYPVPITQVRKRNSIDAWSVAATVYDDKIYAFTSDFTLTSADPSALSHSQLPPLASGQSGRNTRDALTFFPEEGPPSIMVLYGNSTVDTGWGGYVVWDGLASFPLPVESVRTFTTRWIGPAVLMLGTSGGADDDQHGYFGGAGAKTPCIQLIYADIEGYSVEHCEYEINAATLKWKGAFNSFGDVERLWVYPWFETEYDPEGRPVLRQLIGVNIHHCGDFWCWAQMTEKFVLRSDTMVPQNYDADQYGWQGTPTFTGTGTAEELAQLKKYWTLLGVILGPPPFAPNGLEAFEIKEISNVEYGLSIDDEIQHTDSYSESAMIASKTEVKMGLSKHAGLKAFMDVSYKHGWESTHTTSEAQSVGIHFTAGTKNESPGNWGTHAWALFSTPTFLSQNQKIYAYDYDVQAKTGTYLNLDMPTIVQAHAATTNSPEPLTINSYYFMLGNPGGASDQNDIRGLLAGIQPFPHSTDLDGWNAIDWEAAGAPWKIIYGTGQRGSAPVSSVAQGSASDLSFTRESRDVESTGQTTGVEVKVGGGISATTKLRGISETLTAGYDCEWSMESEVATKVSTDLLISYHMPFMSDECTAPDCVESLSVQPYLLQATDYTAPWIPTDYGLNLPWCIAWHVKGAAFADGRTIGDASAPEIAEGVIVGGGEPGSTYSVTGGSMAWQDPGGPTVRIPLSAETFDPSLGASVRFNDHEFRAESSQGTWTREGSVWVYTTPGTAKTDVFTLTLDFGQARWSFSGDRLDLASHLRAGEQTVRLQLAVNGRYTFSCNIDHQARHDWKLSVPPPEDGRLQMTGYRGNFDSTSGTGTVLLHGRLPSALAEFGDLSIVINGTQKDFSLLRLAEFRSAFESGGTLEHDREGLHLVLDFGKKIWSVLVEGTNFHPLLAPRWGSLRLALKVGGAEQSRQEHPITTYSTQLSFGAPRLSIDFDPRTATVTLGWPWQPEGWVLEENRVLANGAVPWSLVPVDQYQTNAAGCRVTLPSPTTARFYRLRQTWTF